MLPTREFFKKIECPFYNCTVKGPCNRPYCHFKHSRRDVDFDLPETSEEITEKEQNELAREDESPEESDDEMEHPFSPISVTTPQINEGLLKPSSLETEREEKCENDILGDEEDEVAQEDDALDQEENLLRFKKALMNAIKKFLKMFPKLFCTNINTNDFNRLVDDFIRNLLSYEESEAVETKQIIYNPTPIIELKKQKKLIKTYIPYIPECVKVSQSEQEPLDIDSDLKYLEDLIQNDSLFTSSDETKELDNDAVKETEIKVDDVDNDDNDGAQDVDGSGGGSDEDDTNTNKENSRSSREKVVCKEKSSRRSSNDHKSGSTDDKSNSKDHKSSSKFKSSSTDHKSSSRDKSSCSKKSSSQKDDKLSSNVEEKSSSSRKHSSSSKNSSSHKSSSKRSKYSSSRHTSSSKSSNSNSEKKSKNSSSSFNKSEMSAIVISSESSDETDDVTCNDVDSSLDDVSDITDNLTNSSLQKENTEKVDNYDEPDYIRKKKKQRIAHVDIFGLPSHPAPTSHRKRHLNPNERFKQIQDKYKGLHRNAQENSPSSTKIVHVSNVPTILQAKKSLTTPPSPVNKTSLLMNDVLKRTELKKTIAQTSKKNNRVAHVPSAAATVTKPMIQVDGKASRIPLVIRQTCLDRIFALCSKYVPPDLASGRAVQVELETYDKCHAAKSYQNSIANSILRIRKEQSAFFMTS